MQENDEYDESQIISLNVGGKFYSTTLSTLRKDPRSMLTAMFSGMYKAKKDNIGRYLYVIF